MTTKKQKKLFTQRARDYEYIFGDEAWKRFIKSDGMTKRRWESYIRKDKPAYPKDKKFADRVVRRGRTANQKKVWEGTYRRIREDLVDQRDATTGVYREYYQGEIDKLDKAKKDGTFATDLKEMNRQTSSRDTSGNDDLHEEYDEWIVYGYGQAGPQTGYSTTGGGYVP